MKKNLLLCLIAAMCCFSFRVGAWGKKGHQMVAQIGFDMLDAKTQQTVQKYLGSMSIPGAGTWMDDVRSDPKYNYMKPWHYINLEKGETYEPGAEANVVDELNKVIDELKLHSNLSDAAIQQDLLILFHLAGDIAQPLHVGYGSDAGGNDIDVVYQSRNSNLHKVWDNEIITSQHITAQACKALYGSLSADQVADIETVDPEAWMKQSRALLPNVYNFQGDEIDDAYITRNEKVIEKQILYAGMRLAAVLKEVFSVNDKVAVKLRGSDTVTLEHTYYKSHFVNSAHIPWVVEYALRAEDVNCAHPVKRTDKFTPDPYNKEATNLAGDYKGSDYDRGHNMPAADNACHGMDVMNECFYFSNMFPQTHRLNAGVWKTLEEQERTMALTDGMIYVWIGSYGVAKSIGAHHVVVPRYCWKVIYDYKTRVWSAYIFPNTTTVSGKPDQFATTVADIMAKTGYTFK